MQVFLCVEETILVYFYFVVWVLLSFQPFVLCHLGIVPILNTQRYYQNSTLLFRMSMGCRPQLCGLSYHLLFWERTVSDPVVGTRCCGFLTYHKAIF